MSRDIKNEMEMTGDGNEMEMTGKRQRSSTRLTRDEQSDGVKAYHVLTYLISTLESEVEF